MSEAQDKSMENVPDDPEAVNAATVEESLPEKQYCVFRAGRERF